MQMSLRDKAGGVKGPTWHAVGPMRDDLEMIAPRVLLVPGLGGSGPDHWQTRWAAEHRYETVVQRNWVAPEPGAWIEALDAAVRVGGQVVLVGHSLGCHAITRWAASRPSDLVAGALLVAPPDLTFAVEHGAPEIAPFQPATATALPFSAT